MAHEKLKTQQAIELCHSAIAPGVTNVVMGPTILPILDIIALKYQPLAHAVF
jgi:hypothetical protein